MKIAFWSPMHGTGATANMLAIALTVAAKKDRSILLTQTHYCMNNLEKPLMGDVAENGRSEYFRDIGIDAVIRYFKAGMLSREILDSCAVDLTSNLSLLAGTRQASRNTYETGVLHDIVGHVLNTAQDYYDWVVVDTNSGYSSSSLETVENADVVVVNLRQNRMMLDELFSNGNYKRFDPDRMFFLFGSYDPDSKYNLSNIRHLYRDINSSNSGGLPYCTTYMDALCDNKAIRYISMNAVAEGDPDEVRFFEALEEISNKIIRMSEKGGNR